MSNPKDTTKTITELKKVAGGALPATVESVGGHTPGNPSPTPGIELASVAAGATAPAPSYKSEGPELPQAPQKKTPGNLNLSDLSNAAAGATAQSYGSVSDSTPQIPEVFPAPGAHRPSMQQLSNVVAAAAASPNIGGSGPGLPNKPQPKNGGAPVVLGDLSNVAAGATGANIGDIGPATPGKPKPLIDPSLKPNNVDVI